MEVKLRSKMSHWPKISHRYVSKGWQTFMFYLTVLLNAGLSSLGVPGVPWHTQFLADQLTLSQPGGQIMPS